MALLLNAGDTVSRSYSYTQPSPLHPSQPQGTGERTGNLFDKNATDTNNGYVVNGYLTSDGTINTNNGYKTSEYIPILPNQKYITYGAGLNAPSVCFYDANKNYISGVNYAGRYYVTFTTPSDAKYVRLSFRNVDGTIMFLNLGDTPLPYEPHGYKIPISSNSTTTPIYLGEVQSTRKIKKLVLDGTENWTLSSSRIFYTSVTPTAYNNIALIMCSHFEKYTDNLNLGVAITNVGTQLRLYDVNSVYSDVTAFTTYLQQQYANGTPVTIWYVLATPQTAVVNEPLRKIGDYADEVAGITIPTIAGANTISVDTTLQPSEVSVNYHGWHPVSDVHVYPDSSWMPTSWEEFRKAVRSGKAQSLYPIGTKLYENWGDTTSDAWIVVDYPTGEDYLDSDLAQQGYTNRVMLMEEKLNYLRQFDAIEAWLYVETAIPAGTYRFTIPNYDASYGGNKTYIFTSTANVPVSGQLTLTWAYNTNPTKVQGYSSSTSTTALFDVNIAEWDGTTACTDLGTIKLAMADADSTYGKLNHIHRARYGSNNYYQSGLRQWLNADATANNWWTPSNIFDRPYDNRNTAGRLNTLNSNMKAVLVTPTVNCITNNLFEYPSLDGTTFSLQTAYTVKDKLFLVTHTETNLSSTPNVNSVLDYYVSAQNADRIKYRKDNGNAYYWWLRTPHPPYANSVRIVSTSGALTSINAINTIGSVAACIIQ